MNLGTDTKIKDILDAYPFIKEKLAQLDPSFKVLSLPMGDAVLGNLTIAQACSKVGLKPEDILAKIQGLIANK